MKTIAEISQDAEKRAKRAGNFLLLCLWGIILLTIEIAFDVFGVFDAFDPRHVIYIIASICFLILIVLFFLIRVPRSPRKMGIVMKEYIVRAGLCLFAGGVGYLLEGHIKAALAYAGLLFVGLLLIDPVKQLFFKN